MHLEPPPKARHHFHREAARPGRYARPEPALPGSASGPRSTAARIRTRMPASLADPRRGSHPPAIARARARRQEGPLRGEAPALLNRPLRHGREPAPPSPRHCEPEASRLEVPGSGRLGQTPSPPVYISCSLDFLPSARATSCHALALVWQV